MKAGQNLEKRAIVRAWPGRRKGRREGAPAESHPDGAPAGRLQERPLGATCGRSEEHTSELQSLMRISYAVFCLKKKNKTTSVPIPMLIKLHSRQTHYQ